MAEVVLERVSRRFATPSGTVVALDEVSIRAGAGLTVIAGSSGSGKSTLLMIVACADRPDEGTVTIGGVEVSSQTRRRRRAWRRRHLGIVVAQPGDNLTDRFDAVGNLDWAESLRGDNDPARNRARNRRGDRRGDRGGDRGRAGDLASSAAVLGDYGLGVAAGRLRTQLSGGEQQRLAFACAVAGGPSVLVADEPTASLDESSASAIVATLRRLADVGMTLIVATHDQHIIDSADDVVRLDTGRRIE